MQIYSFKNHSTIKGNNLVVHRICIPENVQSVYLMFGLNLKQKYIWIFHEQFNISLL